MSTFKIETVQDKPTATGKPRKLLDLVGAEGELLERVTMWGDHPAFATVKGGDMVEGDYKDDGQYRTLFGIRKPTAPGARAGANIAKAQEVKAEHIKEAQERKNDAISKAGAMRDATLVSLASLKDHPFPTDAEYQAEWVKWFKFFMGKAEEPFI